MNFDFGEGLLDDLRRRDYLFNLRDTYANVRQNFAAKKGLSILNYWTKRAMKFIHGLWKWQKDQLCHMRCVIRRDWVRRENGSLCPSS